MIHVWYLDVTVINLDAGEVDIEGRLLLILRQSLAIRLFNLGLHGHKRLFMATKSMLLKRELSSKEICSKFERIVLNFMFQHGRFCQNMLCYYKHVGIYFHIQTCL